ASAARAMNAGANPRLTSARLPFLRKTRRVIMTSAPVRPKANGQRPKFSHPASQLFFGPRPLAFGLNLPSMLAGPHPRSLALRRSQTRYPRAGRGRLPSLKFRRAQRERDELLRRFRARERLARRVRHLA